MLNQGKKGMGVLLAMLLVTVLQAQPTAAESMDAMRSNGKIYVVVAVVVTILLGMFIYLISLDRKIGKVEKELKG